MRDLSNRLNHTQELNFLFLPAYEISQRLHLNLKSIAAKAVLDTVERDFLGYNLDAGSNTQLLTTLNLDSDSTKHRHPRPLAISRLEEVRNLLQNRLERQSVIELYNKRYGLDFATENSTISRGMEKLAEDEDGREEGLTIYEILKKDFGLTVEEREEDSGGDTEDGVEEG